MKCSEFANRQPQRLGGSAANSLIRQLSGTAVTVGDGRSSVGMAGHQAADGQDPWPSGHGRLKTQAVDYAKDYVASQDPKIEVQVKPDGPVRRHWPDSTLS